MKFDCEGGRGRAAPGHFREEPRALGEDERARPLQVGASPPSAATPATWAKRLTLNGARTRPKPADHLRLRHGVAHPQPRQPGDLRERAKRDQPRMPPGERDAVGGVRVVAEIPVGLVEDHERRIVAERREEAIERPAPDDGGRGVVRRAQEDDLGAARSRAPACRRDRCRSPLSGLRTGVAPESRASMSYGSKAGCGIRISSPGSNVARAMSARISSPPLPAMIQSGETSSRRAERLAKRRRAAVRVEVGARGFAAAVPR